MSDVGRMTRDDLLERERELAQALASALEQRDEARAENEAAARAAFELHTMAINERDEAREQVRVLREFVDDLDGFASAHRTIDSLALKRWIKPLRVDMEPKP